MATRLRLGTAHRKLRILLDLKRTTQRGGRTASSRRGRVRESDEDPELGRHHEADATSGNGPRGYTEDDEIGRHEVGKGIAENDGQNGEEDRVVNTKTDEARLVELLGQVAHSERVVGTNDKAETSKSESNPGADAIRKSLLAHSERLGVYDGVGRANHLN